MKEKQIYPYDEDLERVVLGTMLSNTFGYDEIRDIVNEDCFHNQMHKRIFKIFKEIERKGEEPDTPMIANEYRRLYGEMIFVEITGICEYRSLTGAYRHTCRLNDLEARRKLITLGIYLQQKAAAEQDDVVDISNHVSVVIESLYNTADNQVNTIVDAIKGVYKIMDDNARSTSVVTGSPTGFSHFDKKAGGLQSSDLIIIAGETSQGKTSLALSILNNAAQSGVRIAVYSLEMKKEQLAARLMAINSGVSANKILFSPLDSHQFEKLDKSINGLYNSSILFDDRSTSNIDTIINSVRSLKQKYNIDGVVIDYLQILNVNMKGSNKEQQMGEVARRLKNLAKDLDIWIIALSQLSRDSQNPVPNLNRLRDSGQIAEAADIVMLVYRPEYYKKEFPEPFKNCETKDMAMIDVAKGRNIGLLNFLTGFNKETTHFYENDNPVTFEMDSSDENPF